MTESVHVTGGETVSLLLRLSAQVEAADELAEAAVEVLGGWYSGTPRVKVGSRRRLRSALDAYQAAKT